MKFTKHILPLLLAIVMLSTALVGCDMEIGTSPNPSEGLEYELSEDENSYIVIGIGSCTDTEIVIPAEYSEKPVTGIGYNAFLNCIGLTDITIPNSVTSIGSEAFRGCTGLTGITIPKSVTSIEVYAFLGCFGLTSITVSKKNPVYHSDGNCLIETASKTLVAGCQNSVIPNDGSVTSIASCAFVGYDNLTSIDVPDGVTSIGTGAFDKCSNLAHISIPDSTTNIRFSVVRDTAYYNDESNWTDGLLYVDSALIKCKSDQVGAVHIKEGTTCIAGGAFADCLSVTSIMIPDSVTTINVQAFNNCTGLTSITIPDSVTDIDFHSAFSGCSGLTSVTIGNGVTSIDSSAFSGYSSLMSVTIGNSVTSIGNRAFENCTGLTNITIPDSVTSIGSWAFFECTGLTNINFAGTKAQWAAIHKSNGWAGNTGSYTVHCTDGDISKSDS